MLSRVLDIAWKEILQLIRDRRMLPMVIISPVLQLSIYGYAISTSVSNISMAVCDSDNTRISRQLVSKFDASDYFSVRYCVPSISNVNGIIDRGDATVAVVIPVDFSRDIVSRKPAPLQVIVDGSDPNTANVALGYIAAIVQQYSQDIIVQRIGSLPQAGVDAQVRVWYNPTLESRNYMVPGIIALIMIQLTMNLTAMAIVRERERGTIEQLIVTPIKRYELILGKVIPYTAVGYIDILLVLVAGALIFGVPVRGSVLLLLLLSGGFLLTALGTGLFISAISKNQQQATMAISFIMLPNFLLSGFFYPVENMPYFIQLLTYLIPLRYYLVIVRAIFLKGVGIGALWHQVIPMTLLGVVILALSVARFRKKLE